MTAAFHRRVPECSSPTSRSSGFAPGEGVPNSSASSGSLNSSRVVPSIWVISRPFDRGRSRAGDPPAASSRTAPHHLVAEPLARLGERLPGRVSGPGRTRNPGSPNTLASTMS